jgi:hemoglobin
MRPTLCEFAGGTQTFRARATAHHARCLADPELNHPFSHEDRHPHHVERLAAHRAEAMGGPPVPHDASVPEGSWDGLWARTAAGR